MDREEVIEYLCDLSYDDLVEVLREIEDRYEYEAERGEMSGPPRYDVYLQEVGDSKIEAAKVIHQSLGYSIKEALSEVEDLPCLLGEGWYVWQAEEIKEVLESESDDIEVRLEEQSESQTVKKGIDIWIDYRGIPVA